MDESEIAERRSKLHRLQSDLFAFESDRGRLARRHDEAMTEIKHAKNSIAHLEADLEEKQVALSALEHEIGLMDVEIARVKKQMNQLG